jgi:hypothetical protein
LQTYLDAEKPNTPEQDRVMYTELIQKAEADLKTGRIDRPLYERKVAALKSMIAALSVFLLALLRR